MPITEEQLAAIKAANHAKSKAWEEERFLTGDRVRLYWSYFAKRLATNTWLDEKTNIEYETLSRWARTCLNRPSTTIKNCAIMLNYPGATFGTYKLINHLPLKEMREPHMLPATPTPEPVEAPVPAPAPAPAVTLAVESTTLTFEAIRHFVDNMVVWIDKQTMSRKSAGIGELVDFLTENKETVITYMKKNILWHRTLNAIMTAYRDEFIDNEDYEDIVDTQVNEYYDEFTCI